MPTRLTIHRMLARLGWAGALALACLGAWAQNWQASSALVFRHAGLPTSVFPLTMHQDRQGQIWIGSQTGLFRWDGYQLQRFDMDSAKRSGLRAPYVNAIHEDAAGRLWIGTDGGGLVRIDPQTSGFVEIGTGAKGLSDARTGSMAADGTDGLWVGTGKGLNRVNLATGEVQHPGDAGMPGGLAPRRIMAMLVDRRGDLWVGMAAGLFQRPAGADSFRPVPLPGFEGVEDVRLLTEDADGRLWIGTRATGVYVRDPDTGGTRRVLDTESGKPLEIDPRAITDAGNGEVWIGSWGQGIVKVDTRSWSTQRVRHDRDAQASLAADFVSTVFRDRSGLVWSGGPGMMEMAAPGQRAISTWYGSGGRLSAGAAAQVSAILARPDGSVWLGDGGGGVDIVPPDRGPVRRIPSQDGQPRQSLPRASVLSMAAAPDGRVFVATVKGLYVVTPDGRQVSRVELPDMPPTALTMTLCQSGKRLWLGGSNGLRSLDLEAPGTASAAAVALAEVSILTINCSSDEHLWIGTPTGLLRYHPATGKSERPWAESGRDNASLPEGAVSTILRDGRGRLWVAFYGAGVCIVTPGEGPRADRVQCLAERQGMLDLAVNALALDAQGHAWASTDSGIVRIDGDSLRPAPLQPADGLGLQAYWIFSVATTPDGDILFGGNGLTIVHPAQYQPWRYQAPLALTHVDGRMATTTEIRLGVSTRAVQMGFALLDYSAPDRVRYSYRLAPLEAAWTDAPAESRTARYTNLKPGDYRFEVKAQNRVGAWTTAHFPVHVEPAWYETLPARLAAAGLTLLLLWAAVRLRLRMLAQRTAQLREQVAQRTAELLQRTEQLEASRQALRRLGAHTTQTLEDERKRVARELHDELGQQLVAMRMEVSVLKSRAEAGQPPTPEQWQLVRDRVDRFTASMRSLVADLRPPALDGGLEAALQWLAAEYRRMSGANCEVHVDPDVRHLKSEIQTMLFRVAQESLNNVLRHANARNVSLQLRRGGDGWDLAIEDDGVGFDTESPPSGFGLLSMEERTELVGGTLRVESKAGEGSSIRLHLPTAARDREPS